MKVLRTAEEMVEYIEQEESNMVFRGYVGENQLIPTLGRYKLGDYEHQLLMEFVSLPVFADKLSLSTLSQVIELAQHYGIPTRFLDWSYDIKVAIYFALEWHKEDDELAYIGILNTKRIAKIGKFSTLLSDVDNLSLTEMDNYSLDELDMLTIYKDKAVSHIKDGRFTLFDLFFKKLSDFHLNQNVSLAVNKRIVEQKGCFTTSKDIKNKIEPDRVLKLELSSIEKKKVLELINDIRQNNNEPKFFPDLSGVYIELEDACKKIMIKYRV